MSDNVVGIIGATVGIGQYIVNDYVITIAETEDEYGYTMTITRGSDTQTVTLYGLTPEQYASMVEYLEQAQVASAAAQTAQDGAEDARDAAQAALNQAITYASAAATSASNAAQSAQEASDYDYQAAQARYAAVAAKESAVAAQGAAEAAQTAAETAASNAGTSATNAAQSATNAASSETSAAGSASAAAQSATNAAASAAAAAQTLTSVQAEGAAQIAAIDAEGQEVLDSIPADYTELSGDVADLKSAIDEMPEIKDSTESGIDLDISDPDGNVILRLKDGHIQTLNFNSNPNVNSITVAASGADYTSIREAIEAAETAGASNDNPYTIKIAPGSYDVLSYFTSEEIAESDFKGLFVTDGITLEGMGIAPDDVVLYMEMDTNTYNETKRNSVSTLNFHGNVGLKNLTVKSKNIRYSVHDDTGFQSTGIKIRVIENCRFFADFTTSGGYGNISYGAGTDGNKVFVFRDCDFGDLVHIHTNAGSKSNIVIMENCRGFGFTASDYASSVDNYYYVNNCVFNWINTGKATGWTTQHIVWRGNIKGAMVGGWDGMRYEFGDCMRYQHSPVTNYPRAVAMETTGRYRLKTTSSADSVIGVLLYYDATQDYAVVQHSGWLCTEIIGLANPTVGQYLVVGSGGALTLESSDTNAIGKVVCTNNAGQHFIKLSI